MNKKIDHILPTVASAEVNDLKELLEEILAKLTDGNIPDMESLDYLKASVHRYLHTVENAPSKQPQTSVYVHFEEGKITDTVLDKTILECFTIPEIVRLIHRLTLEKIVRTSCLLYTSRRNVLLDCSWRTVKKNVASFRNGESTLFLNAY